VGNIGLSEYTKRDLKGLLANECFWTQGQLPITKRRVMSQIANPRAADNDVVLIVAATKNQLVAYIGILPDLLRTASEADVKFGWLTTWWVDKQSDSRLAAAMVLFAAMKKYSHRLAAAAPSEDARRVYDATKRFRMAARFDRSYFIIALPPSFTRISPVVRWVVGAKNRLSVRGSLQRRGLDVETVDSLSGDLESFIDIQARRDPLGRDRMYWRWVLAFPWISSSVEDRACQRRYAFSAFAREFRQIAILVRRHGVIIGFMLMTLRDARLTLKAAYYEPGDVTDVARALQAAVAEINPWLFVSGDAALSTALQDGWPLYVAKRRKSWELYTSENLSSTLGPMAECEIGDSIFT